MFIIFFATLNFWKHALFAADGLAEINFLFELKNKRSAGNVYLS